MPSDIAQDDPAACTQHEVEAQLVEQAQTDPRAFGELYDLYYGRILGYLYRRTLDARVAEELTSNTFFHALRALPQYRHRGHFSAWLYRIATNEINAQRRTASRQREVQDKWLAELDRVRFVSSNPGDEEDIEEQMRAFARLHEAVECLPEKYRAAVSLRYFESMPLAEIAAVLGKRLGTVKSLIHRGLKQLRKLYGTEPQEERLLQ